MIEKINIVTILAVLVISCETAELGQTGRPVEEKLTSFQIAVEAGNDPALLGEGLIASTNFNDLKDAYDSGELRSQASSVPYPDGYWDFKNNGIAWRWQRTGENPRTFDPDKTDLNDNTRSAAEKYDLVFNQDKERVGALVELLGLDREYLETDYPAALWEYNHHGYGVSLTKYSLANPDIQAVIEGNEAPIYFLNNRNEVQRKVDLLYDPDELSQLSVPTKKFLRVYYYIDAKVKTYQLGQDEIENVLVAIDKRSLTIDEIALNEILNAQGATSSETYALATKFSLPIEGWYGHCNGWVASAITEKEPQGPSTLDGKTFEVGDMKALLAEVYFSAGANFSGNRYNPTTLPRMRNGRANDRSEDESYANMVNPRVQTSAMLFRDVNPGSLYLAVTNLIGLKGLAFAGDRQSDYEIWNQPFFAYEILEQTEITKERANELLGASRNAPYPYNISSTKYASISMKLTYTNDYQVTPSKKPYLTPETNGSWSGNDSLFFKSKVFSFILEMDEDYTIIGGEWLGSSRTDHPDFLWLAANHGFDYSVIKTGGLIDLGLLRRGYLGLTTIVEDDFKTISGGRLSYSRLKPEMVLDSLHIYDDAENLLLTLRGEQLDSVVKIRSIGGLFLDTGVLSSLLPEDEALRFNAQFVARHDQRFRYNDQEFEFEVLDEDNPFIEYANVKRILDGVTNE